jgi:hypothetical protein
METFIAFATAKLQHHYKIKIKNTIKTGNHASTLRNENLD